MKARINYKSKKTIIIIAIAVVLLIAAITGTVAYIKGNNNAAAAMENTEVTEPANNGNDSNNNGGVENPNTPNTDNPEQIPIIDDNQNPTTPAQNGDTTTNPGTTTNQGTTTRTTTGNAGTTVPDTEYTQTTVVENPWKTEDITWAPISLQAITANNGLEICVPSFSIEKSSEIVKYSENKSDKAEVGDTIKYTITVTNTGKVTLNDIEVRDDMVGVSTTIKTLEVGRNEKILAEHVVSEEDIIKSLDNDGIITNIATAIYRNEEKEAENTVEAKNEYNLTIKYIYEDGKQAAETYTETLIPKASYNVESPKIEGYKADKTVVQGEMPFSDVEETVVYTIDEDAKKELSYTVEYYKDGEIVSGDTQTVKTEVQVLQPDTLTVKKEDINTVNKYYGYKFEKTDPATIPETVSNGDVIKVYYVLDEDAKKELSYTVEYYKDGQIVSGDTQTVKTEVQVLQPDILTVNKDTINTVNKYYGYKFEKTDPTTIPETVSNGNVIKVYYVIDEEAKKELSYTVEYYKDGEIVSGDTQTVKTEVQVLQPDTLTVNKDTINTVNKYEGYRFEKTDPTTIPETVSNGDVIKVYYVKRTDLTYTVHYYYNGIEAEEELVTVPGQKYLAEVSDVDHKATYNGVTYEEYDRTTSNGTMPLIIGLGTNYINVYYGTPNVTINKEVNKSTANAGDILHYTIKVTEDRGLVDAKNIKVTDNLPSELNVIQESITQDGKLNDAKTSIEWNVEKLGKGQNIKFEFDAKIKESSIGEVITNKATLNGNTDSNDAITTVNGKTVEVREITKGREADDVNIIFIMDNSSSMNEPIANTSYLNDDSYYVAPSDEQKTRLNSAKTATKEFINKIYADKNLKNTNMSVITFNNNESNQEDTADVIGKGPYTSDKVKEESHLFYTKYYVVENNKKIYVEQATDGNYYEIKDTTIKSGANVVGSATSSDYSELVTKVDGITIGCRREGFGTYINPALKQAKTIIEGYKNNEATKANRNIVIVLCDGDINGKYADSLNDLKGDKNKAGLADEIYCIGFGKDAANPKKNAYKTLANMTTVYEKDKSGKLVKKVYTAENTETLIQEFTSILENMNDKKNYITGVSDIVSDIKCGEIAIKASDILEMPLVVYNNDTEVINCASKEELANYGMSYDESNQIIRWDINECIEKNPNIDLSGTLKLRYYIPLN